LAVRLCQANGFPCLSKASEDIGPPEDAVSGLHGRRRGCWASLVTAAGDSIVALYLPRGARSFALPRIDQILGAARLRSACRELRELISVAVPAGVRVAGSRAVFYLIRTFS